MLICFSHQTCLWHANLLCRLELFILFMLNWAHYFHIRFCLCRCVTHLRSHIYSLFFYYLFYLLCTYLKVVTMDILLIWNNWLCIRAEFEPLKLLPVLNQELFYAFQFFLLQHSFDIIRSTLNLIVIRI